MVGDLHRKRLTFGFGGFILCEGQLRHCSRDPTPEAVLALARCSHSSPEEDEPPVSSHPVANRQCTQCLSTSLSQDGQILLRSRKNPRSLTSFRMPRQVCPTASLSSPWMHSRAFQACTPHQAEAGGRTNTGAVEGGKHLLQVHGASWALVVGLLGPNVPERPWAEILFKALGMGGKSSPNTCGQFAAAIEFSSVFNVGESHCEIYMDNPRGKVTHL